MRGTVEVECVNKSFGLKQSYILPVYLVSGQDSEELNSAFPIAPLWPRRGLASRRTRTAPGKVFFAALFAALLGCIALTGCGASYVVNGATSSHTGTISPSPDSVDFGSVDLGQAVNSVVTVVNQSSAPVEVSQVTVSGTSFTVQSAGTLPVTVAAGGTYDLKVQFDPTATGTATGQLTIATDSTVTPTAMVKLKGTGGKKSSSATPGTLTCNQASITGSGTDSCTVTLSAAAPSGGLAVTLSSTSTAVALPASITVPASANASSFIATVSSVTSAQTATLTATANSSSTSFALQLNAYTPVLSLNATSLAFGTVALNTPSTKSVTLTSTGTAPVTISSAALTGSGFTVSGATFPATLNPSQVITLNVQFDPATAGAASGQLTVVSNSSSSPSAIINLAGTGAAPVGTLSALSCTSSSFTGAGTDACTVTLSSAAPAGGLAVNLSSSNTAVTVPATLTVPANATSAAFTATVSAVTSAQSATLTATAGSVSESFALQLNACTPTLTVSTTTLAFGSVALNTPATKSVTLTSSGTAPVTVSSAALTGVGFTVAGATFPVTLNPSQAMTLSVQFDPTAAGAVTGQLTITSNSSTSPTAVISLSGSGASTAALSALSCTSASFTGAGTDACTVTLSSAAPAGGLAVNLSSSSAAVVVPATLTVPANATSAAFTATVSAVTSAQSATLTATAGSGSESFALQLNTGTSTLALSTSTLSFGNVNVGQTATLPVTLSSTGTAPVTISGISIVGALFTASGVTTPLTLNPGQSATLNIQFSAPHVSSFTGTLTITSNSSANPSAVVNMSGSGIAALSALTCTNVSMSGAGTDACTVTLNGAAPSAGFPVNLSSNNAAVTVPSTVTVPASATSIGFNATASSVTTTQSASLTASAGGVSTGFALQLGPNTATLSINATSVGFGSVVINATATQSVVLTSTGSTPVTVSAATLTGTGFSISGATFPLTLSTGQTATLNVQFDPTVTGAITGQLTISSNSSTNGSAVVSLSGTGAPHEVDLAWVAPGSSTDPVAGYNVYRSGDGGNTYQLLSSLSETQTTYMDTTPQSSAAYDYIVKVLRRIG